MSSKDSSPRHHLEDLASNRLTSVTNAMIPKLEIQTASQLAEQFVRQSEAVRASFGFLQDYRIASQIETALKSYNTITGMSELFALEQSFMLPNITQAIEMTRKIQGDQFSLIARFHEEWMSSLENTITNMRNPWLDITNQMQSIRGLAGLHGIGSALNSLPPFDPLLTDMLRGDLGDWQDRIDWPTDIGTDALARMAFYENRGLNPTLTTFPYRAFEEIIEDVELTEPDTPLVNEYQGSVNMPSGELGFERTNKAHDRIQRFETRLRNFIDARMTDVIGPDWIKHQVPGDMRQKWMDKRKRALSNGEQEWPLIAYADFSDYNQIITRNDNWRECFKDIFGHKASVQESFQRLHPIRLATMHSRVITQDDELLLYVETKRLLTSIRD